MITTLLCVGGYCVALCGSVAAVATLKAAQHHWADRCPACDQRKLEDRAAQQRLDALAEAIELAVLEAYAEENP